MATTKQLNFIKAICDELDLDEPRENITTREASRFISKHVTKFYVKKTRDEKNRVIINIGSYNNKHGSAFKVDKEITRMSTEQNVENMKNILRHYFGSDIWTDKKR